MTENFADVVVIGAGAAGLFAARSLARSGLHVLVLEANDRPGGRAFSYPASRSILPAELGAEFIHGSAHETMQLLREMGGTSVDNVGESWTRDGRGRLIPDRTDFLASARLFEAALRLDRDESVDTYLNRFASDASMRDAVESARAFVEGFDAADPAVAGVAGIAQELLSGVDSATARPVGGYAPIMHHLVEACISDGAAIHLSTVVNAVRKQEREILVDTVQASGEARTFIARAVLVTASAGVLQQGGIRFEPELPADKRQALSEIEMGHVAKVVLQFRSAFWEELDDARYRDAGFFRAIGQPFAAFWTQYPLRAETIAAWSGGPKSIALLELSERERIERALEGFGAVIGNPQRTRAEFKWGATHDWRSDPFARGAYSYARVGGTSARVALAKPVEDILFFAGEATSYDGQGGTVNGAFATGARAAEEIAKVLGAVKR